MLNLALLTQTSAAGGLLSFLPTMLIFGALIYFMIIRPQKKRQDNQTKLMSSIQVGDKIQTIGGFIGTILSMEDDEFVVLSEESKLRVKRNAVAIRLTETAEPVAVLEDSKDDDDDDDFKIDGFEI